MDVSSLVRSITSSFEECTGLVRRIRDRHSGQLDEAAIDELLESLELGPIVVNGYYNADAKRFGDHYTVGDGIAREQLKDVFVQLQMNICTTLRSVLDDDQSLDCTALQSASDDCRVNTGVSLGQLSQRLVHPSRAHHHSNHVTTFPFQLPEPDLKYSHSVSSQSSEGPRTPTTPELEAMMDEFDYPGRLPGFNPHASNLRGKAAAVLQGIPRSPTRKSAVRSSSNSMDSWGRRDNNSDVDLPRSSSSYIAQEDQLYFSPVSPASKYQHNRESPAPPSIMSTFGSIHSKTPQDAAVKERFGPDDYSDLENAYAASQRPMSRHHRTNSPPRLAQEPQHPHRPSHPSHVHSRSVSHVASLQYASRSTSSVNAPIPVTAEDPAPPLPSKSAAHRPSHDFGKPLGRGAKKILGDVDPFLDSFVEEPNMPTEKNLMGYCKGAQRLQCNSEKKGFAPAQKPLGFSGFLPYWKCEKCQFEGPMKQRADPMNKNKPEKIFDPAVREYDGIRFRWTFLAKCHVPTKISGNRPDGTSGSFGCIFCTAEAKSRKWIIHQTSSSISEGKGGIVPSDSTPIFGNSSAFMEHLQMHRQRNYWPNKEMQRRMKCVVGRVAELTEDFEINFMPPDTI